MLLALLAVLPCRAQNQTGVIRGQVTDPSGGTLVGATVLLTTPSGASMDTTTNKEGMYEFKNLAPGTYEIKAVAAGFALFDKMAVIVANFTHIRERIAAARGKRQIVRNIPKPMALAIDTSKHAKIPPGRGSQVAVLCHSVGRNFIG